MATVLQLGFGQRFPLSRAVFSVGTPTFDDMFGAPAKRELDSYARRPRPGIESTASRQGSSSSSSSHQSANEPSLTVRGGLELALCF